LRKFGNPLAILAALLLSGCATANKDRGGRSQPLSLTLSLTVPEQLTARYDLAAPAVALHFPQELGGYRAEQWRPTIAGFRWTGEGAGERIERIDGQAFRQIALVMPVDYRALPKSYAPFSPFSEGSALIHSGQFHACPGAACQGNAALPIAIHAPGKIIGVEGRRTPARERFVSRDDGTNIFVGLLQPAKANGFVAVIDPGLPPDLRQHLDRSLPQSMAHFASIFGPLSFTPELYVSIDDRPEPHGGHSTQGGTLPKQIFMHFDGEGAKERLTHGAPYWLDWFFAHEAGHLFQQDKAGGSAASDAAAWLHEGGADAMAALALFSRGAQEQAYVRTRLSNGAKACANGLAKTPLDTATAAGKFDLHYQCGLLIWLALHSELRAGGHEGLSGLSRAFFAKVRAGQAWSEPVFLATARESGVSEATLRRVERLVHGGKAEAPGEVAALEALAGRQFD
jgi:hypothetical protein